MKQVIHKTKKKNNIMSIVRQCKKQYHVIFLSVNSATVRCFSSLVKLSPQIITAHNSVIHSLFEQH